MSRPWGPGAACGSGGSVMRMASAHTRGGTTVCQAALPAARAAKQALSLPVYHGQERLSVDSNPSKRHTKMG